MDAYLSVFRVCLLVKLNSLVLTGGLPSRFSAQANAEQFVIKSRLKVQPTGGSAVHQPQLKQCCVHFVHATHFVGTFVIQSRRWHLRAEWTAMVCVRVFTYVRARLNWWSHICILIGVHTSLFEPSASLCGWKLHSGYGILFSTWPWLCAYVFVLVHSLSAGNIFLAHVFEALELIAV